MWLCTQRGNGMWRCTKRKKWMWGCTKREKWMWLCTQRGNGMWQCKKKTRECDRLKQPASARDHLKETVYEYDSKTYTTNECASTQHTPGMNDGLKHVGSGHVRRIKAAMRHGLIYESVGFHYDLHGNWIRRMSPKHNIIRRIHASLYINCESKHKPHLKHM